MAMIFLLADRTVPEGHEFLAYHFGSAIAAEHLQRLLQLKGVFGSVDGIASSVTTSDLACLEFYDRGNQQAYKGATLELPNATAILLLSATLPDAFIKQHLRMLINCIRVITGACSLKQLERLYEPPLIEPPVEDKWLQPREREALAAILDPVCTRFASSFIHQASSTALYAAMSGLFHSASLSCTLRFRCLDSVHAPLSAVLLALTSECSAQLLQVAETVRPVLQPPSNPAATSTAAVKSIASSISPAQSPPVMDCFTSAALYISGVCVSSTFPTEELATVDLALRLFGHADCTLQDPFQAHTHEIYPVAADASEGSASDQKPGPATFLSVVCLRDAVLCVMYKHRAQSRYLPSFDPYFIEASQVRVRRSVYGPLL